MTRLESDLLELLKACIDGTLNRVELRWKLGTAVCVVMASGGYPDSTKVRKGLPIVGIEEAEKIPGVHVFHAGTVLSTSHPGVVVTNGGRVLGVTALGKDLQTARDAAYSAVDKISFGGAQFRTDIGAKALQFNL